MRDSNTKLSAKINRAAMTTRDWKTLISRFVLAILSMRFLQRLNQRLSLANKKWMIGQRIAPVRGARKIR